MHAVALGWHDNRDLFHKIGFLIAQGDDVQELLVSCRGKTKSRLRGRAGRAHP